MKRHLTWVALTLLALPAWGQSSAAMVCGKVLNEPPQALSWANYVQQADDPTRRVDHAALADMVQSRSRAWSASTRDAIGTALRSFESGSLPGSRIRLTKTTELPPRQFGFLGTTEQIELPLEGSAPLCSDPIEASARIDAAYVILLVERAHAAVIAEPMKLTSDQISVLESKYDRYLYEGFPMFPWEAWANSKFLTGSSIAQGPPRNALVLLHPGAGVVGSIESSARSDTDGTLSVEALGWIRYREGHESWYGASLLAVFPADRDPGYGVAFNYNIYKVGVTWHDDNATGHDGWALFLGMDFLQFVGQKYRTYESYKQQVTETLRGLGTQAQ